MKDYGNADNRTADLASEFSVDDIIAEVKAEQGLGGIPAAEPAEPGRPIMFEDGGSPFTEASLHSDTPLHRRQPEPSQEDYPADEPAEAEDEAAEKVPSGRHLQGGISRYKRGFSDLKRAFTDEFMPQRDSEDLPSPGAEDVEDAPQSSNDERTERNPQAAEDEPRQSAAAEAPQPSEAPQPQETSRESVLADVERIFGVRLNPEETGAPETAEALQGSPESSVSAAMTGGNQSAPAAADEAASDPDATRRWDLSAGDRAGEQYAPAGDYEEEDSDLDAEEVPGFREKVVLPIMGLFADAAAKREQRRIAARERAERERENRPPEMDPEAAAKLYADQAQSLRMRSILASAVCVVLVWLSYGLPAAGALGGSVRIRSFACLILELTVMVIGLDVFSNGLRTLFRKRPGAESLISVSCLVSILDAVCIIVFKTYKVGLPFCAVSALSLTAALWGYYLSCRSFALSFLTAKRSAAPSVVLSEDGGEENGRVLVHLRRPVTGFVRSCEEADLFEKTYAYFTPILLIFALVLSLVCFAASKSCDNFPHTLAAAVCISASFSTVLGFAFPFYIVSKRLAGSGVAIAGSAGAAELGTIRRVVLKDRDLFPARTLALANVTVEDGFSPDRVTSCTASLIAAADLGTAPLFMGLMKKNGYSMRPIEEFSVQESGGIVARVSGDLVYVGSAAFMKLMGVRVGKGAASRTAICTAINDTLAGIYEISYTPVTSVQRSLMILLRGGTEPVFAVRDFNVTPMLVQQKFRLPRKNYEFPSFSTRYEISSDKTENEGTVAAVFSRGGLNAVAGLIRRGRKLWHSLVLCDILSVLGSFVGMVMMLAMCWQGVWSSASCANAMSFMLLWLVPVFVVSYGLKD